MDESKPRARESVLEQQYYGTGVVGEEECGLGGRSSRIPHLSKPIKH